MLRFEDPWLLIFLLVVPLMVFYGWRSMGSSRIRFSSLGVLQQLKSPATLLLRRGLIVLRCLAVSLFVLAFARPQSGIKSTEITTEGIDIMLCLDTSGSMQALDFKTEGKKGTRLQAVKKVVNNFIRGRKNDRIGMVVFGQEAFTQCPLTLDYGVLLSLLDSAKIGMAGDSTAIGSALGICVKRLKDLKSKSKVIILLTDGRNNSGTLGPATAAEVAKAYNIKTYTIGVGSEGEAPFLVDSFFGKQYVYQKVDLDEKTLKEIARVTDGKYFRATNTKALEKIYQQIDEMEKTEVKIKEYMEYEELFMYFLIPGLCLLLLEVLLANTRLRKIP
jgi:Ca-activated chloride channel family protein